MKFLGIAALAALSASPVLAETIYCQGTVKEMLIGHDGDVMIYGSWRNAWTRICNVNGTVNGVSVPTCSLWAALAAEAVEKQMLVVVPYSNIQVGCAAIPTDDNAPRPAYLRLKAS